MPKIFYGDTSHVPLSLPVKIEGVGTVGHIKGSKDGYYYKPKSGRRGKMFRTVDAVKASIEGGND